MKIDEETLKKMAERYLNGEPSTLLAPEVGVTPQTLLRNMQKRLGVEPHPKGHLLRGRKFSASHREAMSRSRRKLLGRENELRELADGSRTTRELSAHFEVSEECVREEMVRLGIPRMEAKPRPEKNAFWSGGMVVDKQGYVLLHSPDHPYATGGNYVRVHRLAMERKLGRYLLPGEVVDHVNGDTSDNREENLVLYRSNGEHLRATRTGRPKLSREERETLRQEAVRRAERRVEAIRRGSKSDAVPWL